MTKVPVIERSLQKVIATAVAVCVMTSNPTDQGKLLASESTDPMDILVVANRGVSVSALTIDLVRDYFLIYRTHWSTTQKAIPINSSNAALRDDFRAKVLKMSPAEEQRYWRNAKVKGTENEPASFSNTLQAVFKLKGALSYVYRKDFREGVSKVVLVIPAR